MVIWILIGCYIFLNLFLAILLDGFTSGSANTDDDSDEEEEDEEVEKNDSAEQNQQLLHEI